MARERPLWVHLLPNLAEEAAFQGGVAVVMDVLRATTTIIHALASGCTRVLPVAEVEEARALADGMKAGKTILGGEREGLPIPGFDLGNSPAEYAPQACKGATLVLTTTNGTQALLRAAGAERVLAAGFVNFSAVCDQVLQDRRPVHLVCSGTRGEVTLEDVLLAGAFVEVLHRDCTFLNDSARLAWDCFEHHGACLVEALRLSRGGRNLIGLGYEADIALAAEVDRFAIVPELRSPPVRLEIGAAGMRKRHWPADSK